MYKLSDEGGELMCNEVARGDLKLEQLDTNEVMLVDTADGELFVWVGKGASEILSRNALKTRDVAARIGKPKHTPARHLYSAVAGMPSSPTELGVRVLGTRQPCARRPSALARASRSVAQKFNGRALRHSCGGAAGGARSAACSRSRPRLLKPPSPRLRRACLNDAGSSSRPTAALPRPRSSASWGGSMLGLVARTCSDAGQACRPTRALPASLRPQRRERPPPFAGCPRGRGTVGGGVARLWKTPLVARDCLASSTAFTRP